jgi:hypothetical protein
MSRKRCRYTSLNYDGIKTNGTSQEEWKIDEKLETERGTVKKSYNSRLKMKRSWNILSDDILLYIGKFLLPRDYLDKASLYEFENWKWKSLISLGSTCRIWYNISNRLFQQFIKGRSIKIPDFIAVDQISYIRSNCFRSIEIKIEENVIPVWMNKKVIFNLFGILYAEKELRQKHEETKNCIGKLFIAKNDVPSTRKHVLSVNIIDTINLELGSNIPRFTRNFNKIAKFLLPKRAIHLLQNPDKSDDPFAIVDATNCLRTSRARDSLCNGVNMFDQRRYSCHASHEWIKSSHFALFVTCSIGSLEKWKHYLTMRTVEQGLPMLSHTAEYGFRRVHKLLDDLFPEKNHGISLNQVKTAMHNLTPSVNLLSNNIYRKKLGLFIVVFTIATSHEFNWLPNICSLSDGLYFRNKCDLHSYDLGDFKSFSVLRQKLFKIVQDVREDKEPKLIYWHQKKFNLYYNGLEQVCYLS